MPKRIQLSRKKGWRKPKDAVVVSRPSRWGNPYKLNSYPVPMPMDARRHHATDCFRRLLLGMIPEPSVELRFTAEDIRRELKGKDLCCWCPLPQPGQPDHCHAAVLLEIANADPTEESGER